MMNYKTGGKKVAMPEQEKVVDPRAEKSYRGKSFIITNACFYFF